MNEEIPTSVWSGSFRIGGVEVKCHVLSNGKRVIEEESMKALFETWPEEDNEDQVLEFGKWLKGR